jgi:agmatine deiminase
MITDIQTNRLFISDCLPYKQPKLFSRFERLLNSLEIPFEFLEPTKDIWAVDFMPVQISKSLFVRFTYNPDYLRTNAGRKTISDVDAICNSIGLHPTKSELIVDGGNISRWKDKVIMCDKVFHENDHIQEKDVIKELVDVLQIDKLIFVPWDPNDFTGHSDGMVRFIDENTVLINDYSKEDPAFQRAFRMSLYNAGLDWIEFPYDPPNNDPTLVSARGLYLNYLQMDQAVIMPAFKNKLDEKAYYILEEVFNDQVILTLESNDLAKDGGILNCITWNIAV